MSRVDQKNASMRRLLRHRLILAVSLSPFKSAARQSTGMPWKLVKFLQNSAGPSHFRLPKPPRQLPIPQSYETAHTPHAANLDRFQPSHRVTVQRSFLNTCFTQNNYVKLQYMLLIQKSLDWAFSRQLQGCIHICMHLFRRWRNMK